MIKTQKFLGAFYLIFLFLIMSCNASYQDEKPQLEEVDTAFEEPRNIIDHTGKTIDKSQFFISEDKRKIHFEGGKVYDVLENHPFRNIQFPEKYDEIENPYLLFKDSILLTEEISEKILPAWAINENDKTTLVILNVGFSNFSNDGIAINYCLCSYSDLSLENAPFASKCHLKLIDLEGNPIKDFDKLFDYDTYAIALTPDTRFLGYTFTRNSAFGKIIFQGIAIYDLELGETIYEKSVKNNSISMSWGAMGNDLFSADLSKNRFTKEDGLVIYIDPYARIEYKVKRKRFQEIWDRPKAKANDVVCFYEANSDGWIIQNHRTGKKASISLKDDFKRRKF